MPVKHIKETLTESIHSQSYLNLFATDNQISFCYTKNVEGTKTNEK